MPAFNYPKHPLFGIAPILYNWRGDPRHDEYTSHLVGRIRAGRYTSDLWDCNSLYLGYSERIAGLRAPRIAVKSRYTMTAEQRRAWNNGYGDPALNAERARKREAQKQEQARLEAEYEARAAASERERAERDAEWERVTRDAEAHLARLKADLEEAERAAIFANRWQCQKCRATRVKVEHTPKGYSLTCNACGVNASGSHKTLARMLPKALAS